LIPALRKWGAGQNILSYVEEHKNKSGTPTMGGVAFVFASIITTSIFVRKADRTDILCIVIPLAYTCVGLLDDYWKKKRKANLGLRAWQKLAFQSCIALLAGAYCWKRGLTALHLPFMNTVFDIGAWIFPLSVFTFLGTVNAVNLTDGLDGLASAVSVPFFLVLGILLLIQNGSSTLVLLSFSLVGGLLAYLLFNVPPASIFMGDTGSLALGGFASSIAIFTGNTLYIAVLGVMYVVSTLSVILQVVYFKLTNGKRVFLMSPFHHHLQKKGYSESKISYSYFAVTLLVGVAVIASLL
jgi:phospho-N-acetylmuramoyl-pentapeptide-transferase